MDLTHEQSERLIGALVAFLLALLSIFGYNVAVVQPAIQRASAGSAADTSVAAPVVDCSAVLACVESAK